MKVRRRQAAGFALRTLPLLVGVALATPAPALAFPVSFEPNVGQFTPDVLFRARSKGTVLTLRDAEIDVTLRGQGGPRDFLMRFEGANAHATVHAVAASRTVSRYYIGDKVYGGAKGIANASQVRVSELYPGIDLVLHGNPSRVEYDLEVAPGSDASKVRYRIDGADQVSVQADGSLAITSNGRTLRQLAPVAWQEHGDLREPVPAHFKVDREDHLVEFDLGDYDHSRRLVIDPVLDYSTYLGSSGTDGAAFIGLGASGDVYIANTDFDAHAVSVSKLDLFTQEVLFTTTVSASSVQRVAAAAVGASGGSEFFYVAGQTDSFDFPWCLRPAAGDCVPPHGGKDAFVLRFDSDGALDTSWLIGGSGNDGALGVAADSTGSVYVAGYTQGDFATTGDALHAREPGASASDAFVVRIDAATGPVYSTVLGSSGNAMAYGIAVDPAGDMHVAGGLPAYPAPVVGGPVAAAFYSKISHDGLSLLDHREFGPGPYAATAVAAGSDGYAAVAGYTGDASYLPGLAGGSGAYVLRFGPEGFSTLLGDTGDTEPLAMAIMPGGDVVVGGWTDAIDFPAISALSADQRGASDYNVNGFLTRLSASGVSFSSTIGGSGDDYVFSIASQGDNIVLFSGQTTSADFPVQNALHPSPLGQSDSFLARLFFGPHGTPFDFDGNRASDILWTNVDGRSAIWLMDGTRLVDGGEIMGAGTGWSVSHVGDFNGDAHADLVWTHTDGRMAIYLLNGLTPNTTTQLLNAGSGWTVNQLADFDGDGKSDILFQNTDGSAAIWLMDGTRMAAGASIMGPGTGWSVTKVADFDGDGKADLLWTHTDGRVAIWLMDGLTVKSSQQILNAGSGWSVAHTADLDGNGKADIVWVNTDGSIALWLMNGASMASGLQVLGAGSGYSVAAVGDLDGDGKADILLQHADGSTVAWLMDGLTVAARSTILGPGTGWSVRRLEDFNADGKMDIVWQNADGSTAAWLMNGLSLIGSAQLTGAGTGWTVSKASP